MIIEHFILSNSSAIDMNTNSLSAFGILDDMQVQAPPGVTLNLGFHAILIVKREDEAGSLNTSYRMSVFAPNGAKIGQDIEMPIQMQPMHRRARLRVMAEIPIAHSGIYTVRMSNVQDAEISREVSLNIKIMPVAVPTAPGSSGQLPQ